VLILQTIDSLLVSFTNGALQNDPVDEGGWFSQVLAARKTAAEYTLLTKSSILSSCLKKICENQCSSVANFPSCLSVLVAKLLRTQRNLWHSHQRLKICAICETCG
jgi:hypothetical protein